MKVELLHKKDFQKYEFLSQRFGSLFNQFEWTNIYGDSILVYGIYDAQQQLIGGFHLYDSKKYFFKHLNNPPYTPHIGLFFENKLQNKANAQSFSKSIIQLVADFITTQSSSIVTIALPPTYIDLQPFIWKNFKVVPNYTYELSLEGKSYDDIQKLYSTERRNEIKRATKDQVETVLNYNNELILSMVEKTFERKNKSLNKSVLAKILFEYANQENSFSYISYYKGKPSSVAFCIYHQNRAYYILGGYDQSNKHIGAGAAAVDACIKHSINLSIKHFDFEGSMIQNVEKYFRGFGGDMVPFYTINKAPLLLEMCLKFIKRSTF
jgi:lipid II:glycine glycyltransferase (peptidoglycan interpeptide bridge formation enzyme)